MQGLQAVSFGMLCPASFSLDSSMLATSSIPPVSHPCLEQADPHSSCTSLAPVPQFPHTECFMGLGKMSPWVLGR